jgi:hypothetical protein
LVPSGVAEPAGAPLLSAELADVSAVSLGDVESLADDELVDSTLEVVPVDLLLVDVVALLVVPELLAVPPESELHPLTVTASTTAVITAAARSLIASDIKRP